MSLNLHERIDLGEGWNEQLQEELRSPYMEELAEFVKRERALGIPIYPPGPLVFNAFRKTPFDQVKVVIMGQDPYHGPGQAEGLCFSVPKGVPPPPSLVNVFKEIHDDLGLPIPSHGSLHKWADQGILLLNTVLTVRQGEAGSHRGKGWERFTDAALRKLLDRNPIFVLWGRAAQEKVENVLLSRPDQHPTMLIAPHPSPLSAHAGFFGCRHFSKVNRHLEKRGLEPIDWSI